MSAQENEALVRRYFEQGIPEATRGNVDVLHQYFADHYIDHTPLHPDNHGLEGTKEVLADSGQATTGGQLEVLHMAAAGDLVFTHWRGRGTHEQKHQTVKYIRRIEPSGQEEEVGGISLFRIEGGKIVEGWHYHNLAERVLRR